MKHLIDPLDFTVEEALELLELADQITLDSLPYTKVCRGKTLATLFYGPSTRTRLSFESAILRLGGGVLGFASTESSSVSKGESVADTIHAVSYYADICAMRHPKEGAPLVASHYSGISMINVGGGGHQHPTQMLTDLTTIHRRRGRLDQMTIDLCGDSKFGRTMHLFMKSLVRFGGIRFVLISPEELRMPNHTMQDVSLAYNAPYREVETLEETISEFNILYMAHIQKGRFFNKEDCVRLKDSCILTADKLRAAKSDPAVLHPLPRVNEITAEADNDPRTVYFEQVQNGVYARTVLILKSLEMATC